MENYSPADQLLAMRDMILSRRAFSEELSKRTPSSSDLHWYERCSKYCDGDPQECDSPSDIENPIYSSGRSRRSSLGAESILEHDLKDQGKYYEEFTVDSQLYIEAHLGLEYVDEIFEVCRSVEKKYHSKQCLMNQTMVTSEMRVTIVNWLIKVNHALRFGPETVFVAVNTIDRFLAEAPIAQECLQLLAVCALFIAAKMEECAMPRISMLISICGKAYKHHHFQAMEVILLKTLRYRLSSPTSWLFISHLNMKICDLSPLDRSAFSLSRYVAQTCLSCYDVCQELPSERAAAAMVYSYIALYEPCWLVDKLVPNSDCVKYTDDTGGAGSLFLVPSALSHLTALKNRTATNLLSILKNVFTEEELFNIDQCVLFMNVYMRGFQLLLDTKDSVFNYFTSYFKEKVVPALRRLSTASSRRFSLESLDEEVEFKGQEMVIDGAELFDGCVIPEDKSYDECF